MKSLLAAVLLALPFSSGAQQADPPKPAAAGSKPDAKAAGKSASAKPGAEPQAAEGPVLEIRRTAPPDCEIKPVMTDEDINRCRLAAMRYEDDKRQK